MIAILEQFGVLFIIMAAGAVAARAGVLGKEAIGGLNKLIIKLCLPALILANMDKEFTLNTLQDSLWLILISMGCYAALILWFEIWRRFSKRGANELGLLQFLILLGNTAFMGYPIVNAVYGSDGIFYASVFNLVHNFVSFSYGLYLLQRDRKVKFSRVVMNGAFVATVAGFLLFLAPFTLPYVLHRPLEWVGDMTIPLSLLVVGFNLSRLKARDLVRPASTWMASLSRLVLFPAVMLPLLYLLGFRGMLLSIPVLIFATPVGLTAGTMAEQYGSDGALAGRAVILSNLLSVITLPIWAALLSSI